MLDSAREHAFSNMSLSKLLAKGRMVSTRDSIRNLLEKRYGSAKSLLSPSDIPQEITTDFDFKETNPEKVAAMVEDVRQFMRHDVATNQSLAVTIDKLFTSDRSGIRDGQMMPNIKPSIVTPRMDTEVYDLSGEHGCEEEEVSKGKSRMLSFLCCYKKRGNTTRHEEDTHSEMIKASEHGEVTRQDITIGETWDSLSLDGSSMD